MSKIKKKQKNKHTSTKNEKPRKQTFKIFMMWFLAISLVASMVLPAILGFMS